MISPGQQLGRARYQRGLNAMLIALLVTVPLSILAGLPVPVEGIAERVMDATPVTLATWLLLHLGVVARPAALWGSVAVELLIGGLIGLCLPARPWFWRDPRVWVGTAVGMTIFVVSHTVVAPVADGRSVAALGMCLFVVLLGWPVRSDYAARLGVSRRAALVQGARTVAGVCALTLLSAASATARSVRLHSLADTRFEPWQPPPVPAPFVIADLTPPVTSVADFYVMDKDLNDPDLAVEDWGLRVHGAVLHPFRWDFRALLTQPARGVYVTLECVDNPVGGPLMSTAYWTGVPLRRVLESAGLPTEVASNPAAAVICRASDGHDESVPLAFALTDEPMVAYAMNGVYLPRNHGYPVRLLMPGVYGFKHVKWVTDIEVVTHAYAGHWQRRGWTQQAIIQTTARIDVVRRLTSTPHAPLLVAGIAFAGLRGVRAVQVRLNGGAWVAAMVYQPVPGVVTWVQWRVLLPPVAAQTRLVIEARAIDGTGQPQISRSAGPFPDGFTGLPSVSLTV